VWPSPFRDPADIQEIKLKRNGKLKGFERLLEGGGFDLEEDLPLDPIS
jgi:hypothetical protein